MSGYRTFFIQQQLVGPAVAIGLVTLAYLCAGTIRVSTITTIGPALSTLGIWFALSASRGKGRLAILSGALLWMFILWYAFLDGTTIQNISFWRYQSTFLCMVGATGAVATVIRISTRIRLTLSNDTQWDQSCNWGILDLMALSFSAAMVVAGANLRHDLATTARSVLIACPMTCTQIMLWVAISSHSKWKRLWAVPSIVLMCWTGAIASNLILNGNRYASEELSFRTFLTHFPSLGSRPNSEMIVFLLLMTTPIVVARLYGNRLMRFTSAIQPTAWMRYRTYLTAILLLAIPLVTSIFFALASWQSNQSLTRAGWPFHYREVSETTVSPDFITAGTVIQYVAIDSPARLLANLFVCLVPIFALFIAIYAARTSSCARPSNSNHEMLLVAPPIMWSWFALVYVLAPVAIQHRGDKRLGGSTQSCAYLTSRGKEDPNNINEAYVDNETILNALLQQPFGLRCSRMKIVGLTLQQEQLDALFDNHCLVSLHFQHCDLKGDLEGIASLSHLETLGFVETELSEESVLAIARISNLRDLSISNAGNTQWNSWPRKLERLSVGCSLDSPIDWLIQDAPNLRQLAFRDDEYAWYGTSSKYCQHPERFLTVKNCGALWCAFDASLPMNLRFENTPLSVLQTSAVHNDAQDTPETIAHLCDLRSFHCDDVSMLSHFEACIDQCNDFVISDTAKSTFVAKVVLHGTRLSPAFYSATEPFPLDQYTCLNLEDSSRILTEILENVLVSDLTTVGLTVQSKHLETRGLNVNATALNLQGRFTGDPIIPVICKNKNLESLRLVGVAPTQQEFMTLLVSCPTIESLSLDGENIQQVKLWPAKSLKSLSLLTSQAPAISRASILSLESLGLGSRFVNAETGKDQLFVTDLDVPSELAAHWLRSHPRAELDFMNAMESLETMRNLDMQNCRILSITPTPPDLEVIKSWKGDLSGLEGVYFYDQALEIVDDAPLLQSMRQMLGPDTFLESQPNQYRGAY